MRPLVAYTLRRCTFSQHWLPAWVTALVVTPLSYVPGGTFDGSIAIGTVILLITSTWLTAACLGSEPPTQTDVLAVAAGSARVQIGKLGASLLASCALVPVSLVFAWVRSGGPVGTTQMTAALASHVVTCLAGVAIGGVASRPFVRRAGQSFLVAGVLCLVDLAVPAAPPGRALVQRWANTSVPQGRGLTAICLESVLLAGVLILVSTLATVRRR